MKKMILISAVTLLSLVSTNARITSNDTNPATGFIAQKEAKTVIRSFRFDIDHCMKNLEKAPHGVACLFADNRVDTKNDVALASRDYAPVVPTTLEDENISIYTTHLANGYSLHINLQASANPWDYKLTSVEDGVSFLESNREAFKGLIIESAVIVKQ